MKMTDFVLEVKKPVIGDYYRESNYYFKQDEWIDKITKYANFLKKPLTLDMFIGDKALFEGFYLNEDGYIIFDYAFIFEVDKLKLYTIEDMLSEVYLSDQYINLTQHAIKQLGL